MPPLDGWALQVVLCRKCTERGLRLKLKTRMLKRSSPCMHNEAPYLRARAETLNARVQHEARNRKAGIAHHDASQVHGRHGKQRSQRQLHQGQSRAGEVI